MLKSKLLHPESACRFAGISRRFCSPLTSLIIATGELRRPDNLLLTIGVVKLDQIERY